MQTNFKGDLSMKKTALFILLSTLLTASFVYAADPVKSRTLNASGEVTSVDPLYGRVTIHHGAVEGFSGDTETEFVVSSPELLKGLSKRDLIDFTIEEKKGESLVTRITKTGQAPPKEEKAELGKAVQGALVSTGEAMKTVASPLPPAHEVVSGAVGATTTVTGAVVEPIDDTKMKQDF
jgi:Cu/Ag efflux protein CusF